VKKKRKPVHKKAPTIKKKTVSKVATGLELMDAFLRKHQGRRMQKKDFQEFIRLFEAMTTKEKTLFISSRVYTTKGR